jgi:putative membrane protein
MDVSNLPTLNAVLNLISASFLLAGFRFIRKKQIERHRNCMMAAVIASAAFLTSYLIYHYHAGSRPFQGEGGWRTLYFAILISHAVLAAAIVPMVLATLARALRGRYRSHARLGRWTFPLWVYVSFTGIVVYVMLYHM